MTKKKQKEYVTGLRFLKEYDMDFDGEVNRVDIMLFRVLKKGPESMSANPEKQFFFSYCPDSVTPKQIAHCLRSLAYKIGKMEG